MKLDEEIDGLYQLPLAEFTAARNALAKTLKGDEAKRVRALPKPTVVPWTANQLYWRERSTFDRLMKAGAALRAAQIAALKGRADDIRQAADAHKKALSEAVRQSSKLATSDAVHVDPDALSKLLSALSLSPTRTDEPGRLTELVQPAGFEALAGVHPLAAKKAPLVFPEPPARNRTEQGATLSEEAARKARKQEEEAKRRKEKEDAEHQAALTKARHEMEKKVKTAEQALARLLADEKRTSEKLDQTREDRRAAERQLMVLRTQLREI